MLTALRQVVQKVNTAKTLGHALEELVQSVKQAMKTEVCSVYLRQPSGSYVLMATEGLNKQAIGSVSLTEEEGLVGLVASRAEPINLEDAEHHPRYRYFPETGEERYASFMGSPIIHHGEVLGVLVVQQRQSRRFEEEEEAFLVTLSAQLAGVIAHAEATGVLNQLAPQGRKKRIAVFKGISGAEGVTFGEAVVILNNTDLKGVPIKHTDNIEYEMTLFHNSLCKVRAEISRISENLGNRLNTEEKALFDVYVRMLADNALGGEIVNRIVAEKLQARSALAQVVTEHVKTFEAMDDPYLRERAADVKDLGLRVLAALTEDDDAVKSWPEKTILVGEELTASMLGEIPEENLAGLISMRGSRTSHLAILARAMGIPTVMGILDFPWQQMDGQELIVDGYQGRVYTNPPERLRKRFEAIIAEEEALNREFEKLRNLPCETLDSYRLPIWVNTGLMTDVFRSLDRGAEGVGLYRSEVPFQLNERFPSEEEQRQIYREQLEAFHPLPVTMRTLDIGGDKPLPYFPIEEDNPYLGWRGIRVSLDHPEIFLVQVRGMLKASEGLNNLRIMLPMITSVSEISAAISLIHRAHEELLEDNLDINMPSIGVMIEIPATVYQIREIARRVDFLSVGSNDLTQYLLAVDRNNPRVAGLYQSFHPSLLRALDWIVKECHKEGKMVSICGEMAGDPCAAVLLMAMGYDMISMNANNIPRVKSVIRNIHLADARAMLEKVMTMSSSEEITEFTENTLLDLGINPRFIKGQNIH